MHYFQVFLGKMRHFEAAFFQIDQTPEAAKFLTEASPKAVQRTNDMPTMGNVFENKKRNDLISYLRVFINVIHSANEVVFHYTGLAEQVHWHPMLIHVQWFHIIGNISDEVDETNIIPLNLPVAIL